MQHYNQMPLPQKTVIVAEDEPLIRMVAVEMLADAGFHVIEAAHADEALAHLDQHTGEVHLLFTDVHMPGSELNGVDLAHAVRAKWPKVALIVTSSMHHSGDPPLPTGSRFLSKPYDMIKLLQQAYLMTAI